MKKNDLFIIKETGPQRLRGAEFRYEFDVKEDLFELIDRGNYAALNAVTIDYPGRTPKVGYDAYIKGFCYGKIESLGYIVLKEDLEPVEKG